MTLLPKAQGLKLQDVAINAEVVSLSIDSTCPAVACPVCGQKTARLHSRYLRTLADLPWGGRSVRLSLRVRRFRCSRSECPRRIFAERLPSVVEPYARKTTRLHEILRLVGFTLGGEVGTRLLWRLGMMASPSTLLRYVRGSPEPVHPLPNVVELVFRNKVELAEVMLGRAFAAGVLARWVVADSFYGRLHSFREWLEERGRPYVVMVPKTNAVPLGGRRKKIEQHVGRLPEDAWSEVRPEVGRRASRCVTGH